MIARALQRVVAGVVLLASMTAATACGGGDGDDDGQSASQSTTAADPSDATAAATEQTEPAASSADCSSLDPEALLRWGFANPVLIQVRDQSMLDTLRDGVLIQYSPDEYADVITKLHTLLDGKPAEIYDDPKPALDYFGDLNERLKAMLAIDGPVPQATFDEYTAAVGDVVEAIGRQLPIGASLEATCPDLAAQLGA